MNTIYVTASGQDNLRRKLTEKLAEHKQLCEERTTAHALSGDGWHDNPYHDRLQQLESEKTREIASLRQQLESARLVTVDPKRRPVELVQIGSIVALRIEDESGGERTAVWEIAGFGETDVATRKLGYNTPLAQALLNECAGSEVSASLPGGTVFITIESMFSNWSCQDT